MIGIVQDLRLAGRAMLRRRLVTLVVVGSLSLVIAGNTTVFSMVSALVLHV